MTPDPFTLLMFLLGLFLLLVLIALNFDLLANYLAKNEQEEVPFDHSFEKTIENISLEINSYQLSEDRVAKLISICPVEAISSMNPSEIHITISDTKCLGYACLRCVQLLHSDVN